MAPLTRPDTKYREKNSVNTIAGGFPGGYWNARTNPEARLLSLGGICEDAIAGVLSGISSYGRGIGVGSSYGAFMAPLGHIAVSHRRFPQHGQHGRPVAADVEFAFVKGKLWLLQIRPFNESRKARGADYLIRMDQALEGNLNRTVNMREAIR